MKKLIYLISILALSACAGDINNLGNNIPTPLTPEQIKEIKESNEKITGLSSIKDSDGKDIKFEIGDSYTGLEYYSFKLDQDGKIIGIKEISDDGNKKRFFEREGDSNSFVESSSNYFVFDKTKTDIELLKDMPYLESSSLEELKTKLKLEVKKMNIKPSKKRNIIKKIEESNFEKSVLTYTYNKIITTEMYGKEVGLKYSDFGITKVNYEKRYNDGTVEKNNSKEEWSISGAYANKNINKENIKDTLTFKGKAVGVVENYNKFLDLNGNATLTFDSNNETETLNMSFNNWYDVKVSKYYDIDDANFTFSNPNNNTIDENFKFYTDTQKGGILRTKYYGDDKTKPSEVVGSIYYRESDYNTGSKEFRASFGGIKKD